MSGTRVVLDHAGLDRLLTGPDGPVAKDLARRAIRVDNRAKQVCPVDTGRLRSSITWTLTKDPIGLAAVIGTNVEYAPYVELGTRHMAARAFLRRGLQAAGETI